MSAIKKSVKFTQDPTWLSCPECGEPYLHHLGIELFNRKEDSGDGLHISASVSDDFYFNQVEEFKYDENIIKVDSDLSRNPSLRRGGIIIKFACDHCGPHELTISQHKGLTLMEWSK